MRFDTTRFDVLCSALPWTIESTALPHPALFLSAVAARRGHQARIVPKSPRPSSHATNAQSENDPAVPSISSRDIYKGCSSEDKTLRILDETWKFRHPITLEPPAPTVMLEVIKWVVDRVPMTKGSSRSSSRRGKSPGRR